jgi:hypothetical protein|tara:strand:+ start:1866 stop:2360 length:495 start_codon:yes stop_codon:yes gene_type:complete
MKPDTLVKCVLMLASVIVLGMMIKRYNERSNDLVDVDESDEDRENFYDEVTGAESENNAGPGEVNYDTTKQQGKCFPRDRLSASDLLPKDAANSKWAQVSPAGQGDVDGRNYLTSGANMGTNSVGTSLRNANRQLRSEPANPQVKVSPWSNSTIGPDLSRRSLE